MSKKGLIQKTFDKKTERASRETFCRFFWFNQPKTPERILKKRKENAEK